MLDIDILPIKTHVRPKEIAVGNLPLSYCVDMLCCLECRCDSGMSFCTTCFGPKGQNTLYKAKQNFSYKTSTAYKVKNFQVPFAENYSNKIIKAWSSFYFL